MSEYQYSFTSKIVVYEFETYSHAVVYVPKKIVSQLPMAKGSRLRVDGELNGVRFELAIMPAKGRWYILISKRLQKLCGVAVGEQVEIVFNVADQNRVVVPVELRNALEADDEAMAVWKGWTAGKQRSFCYYVDSAKRAETRENRVEMVIQRILEGS